MATVKRAWKGGTAVATNVKTLEATGTWASSDTITTTLKDENGTTSVVNTTTTSSTISTGVIDPHITDLNNSVLTEFAKINWIKDGTTKIKGTADTAGVPFTMDGSESTGGNGLFGDGETAGGTVVTANAGPNDWNTTGNWVGGTKPTADDTVYIGVDDDDIPHSILYGLDQSGIDLNQIITSRLFRGGATVGNPADSKYLLIDISSVAGSSDAPIAILNGPCRGVWLKGNIDAVAINAAGIGNDAVKIHSTNSACVISSTGFDVRGQIRIAGNSSAATITNASQNADIRIETPITGLTNVLMNGGSSVCDASTTNYQCTAGIHTIDVAAAISGSGSGGLRVDGGTLYYNSSGTLTFLRMNGGIFSWERNFKEGVTMTNGTIHAGTYIERGSDNVTHTNKLLNFGGNIVTAIGEIVAGASA